MNQEHVSFNKYVTPIAIFIALVLAGSGFFMLSKMDRLLRANVKLSMEIQGARESLSLLNDKLLPIKSTESCPTRDIDTSLFVASLRAELVPFARRLDDLEILLLDNQINSNEEPRSYMGERPRSPPKLLPPPIGPGGDGNLQFWGDSASIINREQMEQLFTDNAERVRERIAAETDPENPDPIVLQRILGQSQQEMALKLEGILPQEEIQMLFPPPPPRFDWYPPR